MPRITVPKEFNAEQKPVAERIAKTLGGQLGGPYGAWIHRPELASRIHQLSDYYRSSSVIPPKLRLLAVVTTVAHWGAQFPWSAQVPQAISAGVSETVLAAIGAGKSPSFADPDEAIAYQIASELLVDRELSDGTYHRAKDRLGDDILIELVALVGHFTTVSLTAVAFEIAVVRPPAVPLRVE